MSVFKSADVGIPSTIELDELYRTTERLFGSGRTVTLGQGPKSSLGKIVTFSET